MNKEEVLKKLKERFGNSVKIPKNILVQKQGNQIKLILKSDSIRKENMQMAQNAFEGWAFAIYECYRNEVENCIIEVDLDEKTEYATGQSSGHENRFWYRVMKFSEQYKWFTASEQLKTEIQKWRTYIENKEVFFINNVGKGEAGNKEKHCLENEIEAKLAEADGMLKELVEPAVEFGKNPVFRQLPVGLFCTKMQEEPPEKKNMVFTGGKSAIDLWSWNKEEFHVIELKAANVMIGIITEIFFYSNYMRDLLLEDGLFTIYKPKGASGNRGYTYIQENEYSKVNGIMLADAFHPLVKDECILQLMNDNGTDEIKYFLTEYKYEPMIRKSE